MHPSWTQRCGEYRKVLWKLGSIDLEAGSVSVFGSNDGAVGFVWFNVNLFCLARAGSD